jgi:hypothetical protein
MKRQFLIAATLLGILAAGFATSQGNGGGFPSRPIFQSVKVTGAETIGTNLVAGNPATCGGLATGDICATDIVYANTLAPITGQMAIQSGSGINLNTVANGPVYLGTGELSETTSAPLKLNATSGTGVLIGAPTGGDKGIGTINLTQLYQKGQAQPRIVAATLAFVSGTTCTVNAGIGTGGCTYNGTGNYTTSVSPAFTTVYGCSIADASDTSGRVAGLQFGTSSVNVYVVNLAGTATNSTVSFVCAGV